MTYDFDAPIELDDTLKMPAFDDVLAELQAAGEDVPGDTVIFGLSGLSPAQLDTLKPIWAGLPAAYRRLLMQSIVDVSEQNYVLDYDALALFSLKDADPGVRQAAIEALGETESITVMDRLIKMAQADPDNDVRAEATRILGRYILLGELGNLPATHTRRAEELAIHKLNDDAEVPGVRRRALEAIANCSRSGITPTIEQTYASDERENRLSAVVAMGRTCDGRWSSQILNELESDESDMRAAAARAAGELRTEEAVPLLARILHNDEREAQEVAIWALGEIATQEATRLLSIAAEIAEDNDDVDFMLLIEEALANASLMQGDLLMMDMDALDED